MNPPADRLNSATPNSDRMLAPAENSKQIICFVATLLSAAHKYHIYLSCRTSISISKLENNYDVNPKPIHTALLYRPQSLYNCSNLQVDMAERPSSEADDAPHSRDSPKRWGSTKAISRQGARRLSPAVTGEFKCRPGTVGLHHLNRRSPVVLLDELVITRWSSGWFDGQTRSNRRLR